MKIKYPVSKFYDGMSIYEYMNSFHLGKPKIEYLSNYLYLNGQKANLDNILHQNDILEIDYLEEVDFLPDKKKLDIVYEDDYLLIVSKPTHILVHPDAKNKQGTMCNIVSYYYQNKGIELSVKYAHRLDMDTTGLLIFVKDALVHAKIDEMISHHELKRTYLCLVLGKFKEKNGIIDLPIGKDRHHNQRRRVSKTGKHAKTYYEVLEEFGKYSLLKVVLSTGRTHQIRVHLKHIGHPLLGDVLYGEDSLVASRVLLHSYQIEFTHPVTMQPIQIIKKVPFDMAKFIRGEQYK